VAEFEATLSLLSARKRERAAADHAIRANRERPDTAFEGPYLAYLNDVARRFPNVRLIGFRRAALASQLVSWDGGPPSPARVLVCSASIWRPASSMVEFAADCDLDWHGANSSVARPGPIGRARGGSCLGEWDFTRRSHLSEAINAASA